MRKNKNFFLISLMVGFLTALLISGCGGGGGGGGGTPPPQTTTITLSGQVYDDILDGATVYFYLTDPNNPIAQTSTHSDGTYQKQISVSNGTEIVYTRAAGGKFASTGEEFSGKLYGVAKLADAQNKALQVHLNPVTSLLHHYLTKTSGVTMDDALAQLKAKLKQIDASAPDAITSADLPKMSGQASAGLAPLVQRISNLIGYQVNQQDPNVSSIDRVIDRMAAGDGGWLPEAFKSASGLRQSLELAEAAGKLNGKGELTGRVVDLDDPNNPIGGAMIGVRGTSFQSQTDKNGNFFFPQLPTEIDLVIDVYNSGYASTQAVTKISSVEKSQGLLIKLKAVVSRVAVDIAGGGGIVARYHARAKTIAAGGLQLSTLDNAMTLTFPSETLGEIRRSLLSRSKRYSGSGSPQIVYVKMTPLDPTREIDAFPGDFTTSDPNAKGETGEKRGKKLESVVLGEFSLEYEDGTPVTDIDLGPGVEIRFRLPDALQDMYKQSYEQGERTIPWYAYDPNDSVWVKSEKPSQLIMVDGVVYAVATATHFSWWNVDWPVITHGCIEGYVRTSEDAQGEPLAGVQIQASGIDYQGQSYAMTDSSGHYSVTVKKDAWSRITARFGEYEVTDPNSIYVDQPKSSDCKPVDITFQLVNICGRVYNSQNNQGIRGAYVYASTGVGKFTDSNGDFQFVSAPNTSMKLKVSYTSNRINHHVSRDVTIADADLCDSSKILIPINLSPQYVRGTVKIIENKVKKTLLGKEVKISADNGFTTANDPNGGYEVVVESGTEQVKISYRYYAQTGTYLEQRRTISWVDTGTGGTPVLQMQGDPNVTFELRPVRLYGTVIDKTTGAPLGPIGAGGSGTSIANANVRISTTLGTYTLSDPVTGEYELSVPSDTTFEAVARLVIPEAGLVEEQRQTITTGLSDEEKVVDPFVLDSRVARITGQVKEAESDGITASSKALESVSIVSEYKGRTQTDKSGNFTLIVPDRDVAAKVRLAFTCDGYEPEFKDYDTPLNRGTSTVTVILKKRNHRPIIQKVDVSPGLKVCLNDVNASNITLNITAVDVDSDHLSYSVAVAPNTAPAPVPSSSDPNHFTWDKPQAAGVYFMTVTVSETDALNPADNLSASVRLPIELVNCTSVINKNPVIVSITPAKSGVPTETKSFDVVAYDPDGDVADLNYQWHVYAPGSTPGPTTDLISAWSVDSTKRSVNLTIPSDPFTSNGLDPNQPAKFTVGVTVTDGPVSDADVGKAEKDTYLTVLINRPPVIKSIRVESIKTWPGLDILGDTVKLFVYAVDPDDPGGTNPLTYTWSCLGTIGSDPNMTWTIPNDPKYIGNRDIKLTVQDNDPAHPRSTSQSVPLVVGDNTAPSIILSAAKTKVTRGDKVNIDAVVTDREGRTLSYEWSCVEGTILSGQGTYHITWEAPQTDGDHIISLKVKDGLKETTSNLHILVATLTVDAGEDKAIVLADLVGPPSSPISLNAQINVSPSGEPYTLTWEIDPASKPVGATALLDSLHTASTKFITNKAGKYHILVTVTMNANSEIFDQDDVYVQVYQEKPPSVSGYVKDAQGTTVPVSQAAVEMYNINGRQAWDKKTVTDENGYYEFTDVPPGTYYVIVARNGYLQMTKTVTIPAE